MARVVAIGTQDFEKLVANNSFYIDKTHFIKEWWESRKMKGNGQSEKEIEVGSILWYDTYIC